MNQNELVKEICKREQGVNKGLNAAQVKAVLRHLGDISLVELAKFQKTTPKKVTITTRATVMSKIISSALKRAKK